MRIRDAVPGDLDAMSRAKAEAGRAAWTHILPVDVIDSYAFPERWIEAVVRTPPKSAVLVVEIDSQVVGFAVTQASRDVGASSSTGALDAFYTHPDVWGLGVGRALLEAATTRIRANGFEDATLWTARENHRPRRIYEIAGWRLDGAERRREAGGIAFEELRFHRRV